MKKIKEWKLKHKIILHIIVIGMLSAISLAAIYFRTQTNIIQTMSQQKAELVGSMIERSLCGAMREGRTDKIETELKRLSSPGDLKKIRIIDPKGRILHSSAEDEIGNFIEASIQIKIKDILSQKPESFFIYLKSKETVKVFRPMGNKTECFGCHHLSENMNGILEADIDNSGTAALLKKNQIKGILIGFLSLFLLTIIILRLFEKLIAHPISQLKDSMKQVQEGDLAIQSSFLRNDEIGSLAQSFNTMVQKVRVANQKIEELFGHQMEKAEHLASIGELAAGLAHEIKNPLAGMKGALEIISQKTDATDSRKEIFAEILLQIDKINNIIHDLLRYAKPKELSPCLVDINESIKNAIKLAKPQFLNKEIDFSFKALENGGLAFVDPDKIQEITLNLVLNSVAAIRDKGRISVELTNLDGKNLEMRFSDDGTGINKEHLPQIFNPFFTTKHEGTGLGLSICKKIVESHRGSIAVESKEGEGTTFIIHLPVLKD